MSLQYLLSTVICKTFEKVCGKWQAKKSEPKAFLVSFSIPTDYDKEEGYRHLDLVLYAEFNYVSVYTRERWEVISVDDLEEGDDAGVKPGKDYTKGDSGWNLIGSHDSCWREMVQDFISTNASRLNTFNSLDDFYTLTDPIESKDSK
jgi:hypothetical protein